MNTEQHKLEVAEFCEEYGQDFNHVVTQCRLMEDMARNLGIPDVLIKNEPYSLSYSAARLDDSMRMAQAAVESFNQFVTTKILPRIQRNAFAEFTYLIYHRRLPGSTATKRLRKKRKTIVFDWYDRFTKTPVIKLQGNDGRPIPRRHAGLHRQVF